MENNKKTKIYVASEIFVSADLPRVIQDLCIREPATYRVEKELKSLTPREKRDAREKVTQKKTVKYSDNGEQKEKEVESVTFDKQTWRYYFECTTFAEFGDFMEKLNESFQIPFTLQYIDPDCDEILEKFFEINLGIDPVDEGSYLMYFDDLFLLEELVVEGEEEE